MHFTGILEGPVLNREAIKVEIHAVLEQDPRLVFAYLYGSFCREEPFQDIDIGVYAENSDVNPYVLSADLKERLSAHLRGRTVDLPSDRFHEHVSRKYRECAGLLMEASLL
jgi:predicted nucleotidyltransferase